MHAGLLIYDDLYTISGGYLYDRKLAEYLQRCGDTVRIISIPRKTYALNLIDNCSYIIFKKLYNLNVDILIEDELNHPSLFLINYLLKEKVNYPIISIVHHLRVFERFIKLLKNFYRCVEFRYLQSVDGFIYNSNTTKNTVETLIKCKKPSIVAYPGSDQFTPNITEDDVVIRVRNAEILRIIFWGNVIPRKGLHILLNALERLKFDNWVLNVVGRLDSEKSYTKSINKQVKRKKFENKVHFTGLLSNYELLSYLRRSDLLVVPSFYEGFGIVYLEGMGFGLPVIATKNSGTREIIQHGKDGFLVEPDDYISISDYIEILYKNKKFLLGMSLQALDSYRDFPKWESTTKRIREFLKSFIK